MNVIDFKKAKELIISKRVVEIIRKEKISNYLIEAQSKLVLAINEIKKLNRALPYQ